MKLNIKRTILVGFGFLAISAFWQIYDGIIPRMLTNTFGFSDTLTGAIMAIDNVLAVFLLPIFGTLSDKTKTQIGKRMPFIVVGGAISIIAILFLPIADRVRSLPFFLIVLSVVLLSMASYRSPAVALMPDLTPKPLRSKGNAIISLMGTAGGIITLIMIKYLITVPEEGKAVDYRPVFFVLSGVMLVSLAILFFTIKENQYGKEAEEINDALGEEEVTELVYDEHHEAKTVMKKDVKKSFVFLLLSVAFWYVAYNAVTTAYSRYAERVFGQAGGTFVNVLLVAVVAAVASFVPIAIISGKIGRKKTIVGGVILITISYAFVGMFDKVGIGVGFLFAIIGISWAAINVNSYPMVVEMSRESDVGKYTGLYYTFSMAAQIIAPIFSGYFMDKVSNRTLFPFATVFSFFSLVTMLNVRHGDSKPVPKKSLLENFDVDD